MNSTQNICRNYIENKLRKIETNLYNELRSVRNACDKALRFTDGSLQDIEAVSCLDDQVIRDIVKEEVKKAFSPQIKFKQ